MAKKKPSKKNDQPELPLDAAPEAPAPDVRGQKSEDSPKAAQLSTFNIQPSTEPAPDAPKRKKGEKVQDEQAPLAISYRWNSAIYCNLLAIAFRPRLGSCFNCRGQPLR